MYDWTDDMIEQACQSFPHLRYTIMQAADLGDIDAILDLMLAHETKANA